MTDAELLHGMLPNAVIHTLPGSWRDQETGVVGLLRVFVMGAGSRPLFFIEGAAERRLVNPDRVIRIL